MASLLQTEQLLIKQIEKGFPMTPPNTTYLTSQTVFLSSVPKLTSLKLS